MKKQAVESTCTICDHTTEYYKEFFNPNVPVIYAPNIILCSDCFREFQYKAVAEYIKNLGK